MLQSKMRNPLEELVEWLHQYPAVYFYGIAGLGKTTFVKSLIKRWEAGGKTCTYFLIPENADQSFADSLPECIVTVREQLLILDQFENIRDEKLLKIVLDALEHAPGIRAVLYVSRKLAPEAMRPMLWERRMKELPGSFLLISRKKFASLATGKSWNLGNREIDALYEYSKGVWGIWQICRYLLEEWGGMQWNPALFEHPMLMSYIEQNIWRELTKRQQELCRDIVSIPILNQHLNVRPLSFEMEEMERMGLLCCRQRAICEVPGFLGHLMQYLGNRPENPKELAERAGDWYAKQELYQGALACYLYCQNKKKHRACMYRYYRQAFQEMEADEVKLHLNFSMQDEASGEAFYLWGMSYLEDGDLARMKTMLEHLERRCGEAKGTEAAEAAERYLNLLYYMPECPIRRWLEIAHELTARTGRIRLYSFHNSRPVSLCGVKDFSELFLGRKKEIREYHRLWTEIVQEEQWYCFTLAEAEYRMETNRTAEAFELASPLLILEEDMDREQIAALFGFLSGLVLRGFALQRGAEELLERYYRLLEEETDTLTERNAAALRTILHVWQKDSAEALHWLQEDPTEDYRRIQIQNSYFYFQRARNYMLHRQYERALVLYERLAAHFSAHRQYRARTECLMGQAVCLYRMDQNTAALKQMTLAMSLGEHYRYVGLFGLFGEAGRDLLEEYLSISDRWQGDGQRIHMNRKSYYYGNVIGVSYENYIQVLRREVRRNAATYPIIGTGEYSEKDQLTMTEISILIYIEQGYSNGQIAEKMNIRVNTVKKHIYNIYKKLDVNSRVQAIQKGKVLGLLPT